MDESAIALSHVIFPETIVPGPIRPYLHATTIAFTRLLVPFTLIKGHIGHALHWFNNALDFIVCGLYAPVEYFKQIDDLRYDFVRILVLEYFQRLTYERVL